MHGGVGAVGDNLACLHTDLKSLDMELSTAAQQVQLAFGEAHQARMKAAELELELDSLRRAGGSQVIAALQRDLLDSKADRVALEETVLTLSGAVTALMQQVAGRPQAGLSLADVEDRLKIHAQSVDGRLDSIRQEMKGGGISGHVTGGAGQKWGEAAALASLALLGSRWWAMAGRWG